jgi:hypothetical protein
MSWYPSNRVDKQLWGINIKTKKGEAVLKNKCKKQMFIRDSVTLEPLIWQNKQDWVLDEEKYGENYERY